MFGISERAEGVENSLMALADYWEEGNERGAYFAALPSSYYLGLLYYNFLFYNIEGIYGLSCEDERKRTCRTFYKGGFLL